MDLIPPEARKTLVNEVLKGYTSFGRWFNQRFVDNPEPAVIDRIAEKNTRRFIEMWASLHRGSFPEPDWSELERSHELLRKGREDEGLHPLYILLFNGVQACAVEVYLEDSMPPGMDLSGRMRPIQ